MFTKLLPEVLQKCGERLRTAYLVPQAVYTLALAAEEDEALKAFLPPGMLEELAALCEAVDKARQDKTIVAEEAKHTTGVQQTLVRSMKVWRRQVSKHVEMSELAGADIHEGIVQYRRSHALPILMEDISKMIGLLEKNKTALDGVGPGTQELIDEGKRLYQQLLASESEQEQARSKDLPLAVVAFNIKKGQLYVGLKMVNAAAHRLHARDPVAAARFNLGILNHHQRMPGTPEPAVVPPAAPPAQTTDPAHA